MKKSVRALGVLLSFFAVLAFASPAFACGGGKKKDKTAEKTQDSKKASMKDQKQAQKDEKSDDEEPS